MDNAAAEESCTKYSCCCGLVMTFEDHSDSHDDNCFGSDNCSGSRSVGRLVDRSDSWFVDHSGMEREPVRFEMELMVELLTRSC